MRLPRKSSAADKTQVVVLTADQAFEAEVRETFSASQQVALQVVSGTLAEMEAAFKPEGATVAVVDLDSNEPAEMCALDRVMARVGAKVPVVVVMPALDQNVARTLLQMRVADFLIKPISPVDLVRTCAHVATPSASSETSEAEILTFLPAVGGAGVTTLAVQSAMMLLNSGQRGKASTCLVDLDFQHGACADYLDLDPRLDLGEIEPRPERLDRCCPITPQVSRLSRPRTARPRCGRSIRRWLRVCLILFPRISITWCSICRAPGSRGPTACSWARTPSSSSAR
jgi:pilus assembly protein CpaE